MLAGVMLTFIIPLLGLAIDAGTLYAVKAKSQSAVDGAALSAARSLSRGLDLSSQQGAATDTAIRWYHANIPNGWMNVTNIADPAVSFPSAPPKTTIVKIAASIQAPTYFMRIVGINSVTISVVGQATRRDVNIILVLDRSGSLYQSGSCDDVQSAASQFVSSFVNGRDRLGLVTFGTDYRVDFPPSMNFGTGGPPNLATMVGQLYCYGYTNAAAAYWTAYEQLKTINDQGPSMSYCSSPMGCPIP
jgi:Flp pilus assembly protein TadG